eukprot:TRINITY_DN14152_c0_g1_i1.p1 TRINITY_DN14152_c0_g1~~TRINITY_DN14152_c0_g1_i1.p1  ORF type:complete len:208 (+),score=18.86 TRINITY_DN14152_c0_g1_i1:94-717(+)
MRLLSLPSSWKVFVYDVKDYWKWGDPCQNQIRLNTLLAFFVDFCSKHDIKYFLDFGSLLGAIRHGKLIPWDHDLDCGVLPEDFLKIKTLGDEIKQLGEFEFRQYSQWCYRIYHKSTWIDIDCYEINTDKGCLDSRLSTEEREGYDMPSYKYDEVYPLQQHRVGDVMAWVPAKPREVLAYTYSDQDRYPLVPFVYLCAYHPLSFWKLL